MKIVAFVIAIVAAAPSDAFHVTVKSHSRCESTGNVILYDPECDGGDVCTLNESNFTLTVEYNGLANATNSSDICMSVDACVSGFCKTLVSDYQVDACALADEGENGEECPEDGLYNISGPLVLPGGITLEADEWWASGWTMKVTTSFTDCAETIIGCETFNAATSSEAGTAALMTGGTAAKSLVGIIFAVIIALVGCCIMKANGGESSDFQKMHEPITGTSV